MCVFTLTLTCKKAWAYSERLDAHVCLWNLNDIRTGGHQNGSISHLCFSPGSIRSCFFFKRVWPILEFEKHSCAEDEGDPRQKTHSQVLAPSPCHLWWLPAPLVIVLESSSIKTQSMCCKWWDTYGFNVHLNPICRIRYSRSFHCNWPCARVCISQMKRKRNV